MIEALITLVSTSFMMVLISSIAVALLYLPSIPYITQLDLFKLQLEQIISRSENQIIESHFLCFDLDVRRFCIETFENRLVKTPGFEILLDHVSEIRWEMNDSEITLYGINKQKSFVIHFKIK